MRWITALLIWLLAWPALTQVQGVMLDEPLDLPPFAFTNTDLDEGRTLIMFGFLSCPDICPFTLGNLEAIVTETGMRVRPDNVPNVVVVSVGPERDAAFVSEYAKFFHPDFTSFTGTRDQIYALIEATDSFYRLMKPDHTGYYEVQHYSSVSVIAPDGTLRAKLQPPFDPAQIAEFLARLQISYRKELAQ
ncbi:SCO family protein [Actibacterium sp. 188UL27-1]|uniref:SCO family protein n=1 Tax=Actibacterium sp. 188UL27-1 TaxID=2786961 RepID=UPI00195A3C3F|nr:SCO family protein [Actibacterium sp. 188UL27-1]MBM7067194.1 SCO family protein [Actibacterium sp. 188UL27-1]